MSNVKNYMNTLLNLLTDVEFRINMRCMCTLQCFLLFPFNSKEI